MKEVFIQFIQSIFILVGKCSEISIKPFDYFRSIADFYYFVITNMICTIAGYFLVILMSSVIIIKLIYFSTFIEIIQPINDPSNINIDSKKEIRFLQYNIYLRPKLLHLFTDEYMKERSLLIAKAIADYDIVCLNEAFHYGSSIIKEFLSKVKEYGFNHSATLHKHNFFSRFFVDGGALIISKYPIIEIDTAIYSDGTHSDKFSAKGVIYTKIQISKNKHIHVLSTHLQASYGYGTEEDRKVRSSQIGQIVGIINKHKDNFPIFLLGDMNTDSIGNEKEYYRLMNLLNGDENYEILDTLYLTQGYHPVTSSKLTNAEVADKKCFDYIFLFNHKHDDTVANFSSSVRKFEIKGKPYNRLSDHLAVESVIKFNI